ncbi:hypothetical protein GCM10011614_12840 [Novosphingobium colocasiae]|uniref:Uncharacterized protein n=1 Tax=Novosphingobium colocasiae TaxID=1256513 RepID=A0A918PDP2_9SPHN|nr:hypothetical protein GCM10011614_12840 [Novosphingobium colocasiae]
MGYPVIGALQPKPDFRTRQLAVVGDFVQKSKMGWRIIVAGTFGLLLGWGARYYVDTDSCLDAGGRWETRGSYCYGARAAD